MQTSFVLVGLLAVLGATFAKPSVEIDTVPLQQRAFESVIEGLIDQVRETLAPYDPLLIDQEEISIAGHDAQVTNLNAEGFSNIIASRISLGGLITWTLDLVLDLPKVAASVENWQITGDTIYGNGAVSVDIENIQLKVRATISVLSVSLKTLKITPSIGNAAVSVTGLYNSEEMSQEVSNKINEFLNDTINNDTELHDKISAILFDIVDKILSSALG